MILRTFRLLLDPDPAANGGGGGATKTDPPAQPDVAKAVEDVLKKHGGDQGAAIRALLTEHNATRDQLSAVTAKLPKEGHVVIDPDTHKLFGTYQSLGKPEEITSKLEQAGKDASELAGLKREKHLNEVAGLVKYKPSVLGKLAEGLEIVIEDGKDKAGQAIKVPKVKTKDEKGADVLTPLTEHAEKSWKDFLPALKASEETKTVLRGSPPAGGHTPPRPPITPQDGSQDRMIRRPNLL